MWAKKGNILPKDFVYDIVKNYKEYVLFVILGLGRIRLMRVFRLRIGFSLLGSCISFRLKRLRII